MAIQHRIFMKRDNKNIKKHKTASLLSPIYLQMPPITSRKTKKKTSRKTKKTTSRKTKKTTSRKTKKTTSRKTTTKKTARYKKAPLNSYQVNLQKKLTKKRVKKGQQKIKPYIKAYTGKTSAGRKFKTKHFVYKGKRSNKLRFSRPSGKRNKSNRSLSFFKRHFRSIISTRKKFAVWVRFANKVQKVRRYKDRKRIVRLFCKKTYFRKRLSKKPRKLYFLRSAPIHNKQQIFRVRRRTIVNVGRVKKPIDKIGEVALALKRKILLEYPSVEGYRWYKKELSALLGRGAAVVPIIAAVPIKPIIAAVPIKPAAFKAWIEPAIWNKMSPAARRAHLAKKEEHKSLRLEFFKKQNAISAKKV
jgi:hypothetical protein